MHACTRRYFVDLRTAPAWLAPLRFTSFWYYTLGFFLAYALPTTTDRADFAANGTLSRYAFSRWSWDGTPQYDVLVLLGFALAHRLLAYVLLRFSNKLRFS